MSERSGVAALADALGARRQALRGFGLAAGLTAVVFGLFVSAPGSTVQPTPLYLLLSVVLFAAAGAVLTLAFLVGAAYRLNRSLENPEAPRE